MSDEAERQRWLLAALAQTSLPLSCPAAPLLLSQLANAAGFAAYRRNASATAERALAAAYPTVQQLLGDDSFAGLARDAWQQHPPTAGDLALWDGGLLALIADADGLADEAYLTDVAALDWAVHRAECAADAPAPAGLERLAEADPQQIWLQLASGTALIESAHPVASIWLAHRRNDAARFDAVRVVLASGLGENALVQRHGLRVQVQAVDAATAHFTGALLNGLTLADALARAGETFDFAAWLLAAVQQRQLVAVRTEFAHA